MKVEHVNVPTDGEIFERFRLDEIERKDIVALFISAVKLLSMCDIKGLIIDMKGERK